MIITTHAFARAGLVGNPSDGYFGKTISVIVRDFRCTVRLWESPHFEIVPDRSDLAKYDSVADFLKESRLMGYYGAMRLIKATVKRFHETCLKRGKTLDPHKNFTLGFESDIPRLVGLSGSSAIVIATLRALMKFYDVQFEQSEIPTLALGVETQELDIAAGLQDRVIQTYEGMVYMDFDKAKIEKDGIGTYTPIRPEKMPTIYIAYDPDRAEVSGIAHRNLRKAWESGDAEVVGAMERLKQLTDEAKAAIERNDMDALHRITNENFEVRKSIMPIAPENQKMIDAARSVGASAKFAGSGGAIVGVYQDGAQLAQVKAALGELGCETILPSVFPAPGEKVD